MKLKFKQQQYQTDATMAVVNYFESLTEKAESMLGSIKYDLVAEIAKVTRLTRKTVVKILQGLRMDTFYNFRINPESFIKEASNQKQTRPTATRYLPSITFRAR